jgi:Na+/proline symporter
VGVMLWVYYQQTPMAIPIPEIKPGSGIKANDYIYPIFMMTAVPHLLKGFLIVAILSAAMSSVSSALTSLASVSTMDFVKPLSRKVRSEEFFLKFSKGSTVALGCVVDSGRLLQPRSRIRPQRRIFRGLTSGALLGACSWCCCGRRAPLARSRGSIASLFR